jgi:SNF2 family DNA or RNA helicase
MTAARVVVMGEIAWTPTDNDEAIDRVWRISQNRHVEAPILTWPDAVEERVLKATATKAISSARILDQNLQKLVDIN